MSDVTPWLYRVKRCTTDKLDMVLNNLNTPGDTEFWDVQQIQHVGGRDWVIITRIPALSWDDDEE